jgi:ATP-binding cassette, subfamily B, bacterial
MTGPDETPEGWRRRFAALSNIEPLVRLVWQASPRLLVASLILRVITAFLPLAALWVAKLLMDRIVLTINDHRPLTELGWLVFLEFVLVASNDVLNRLVQLIDNVLGDRFTNHLNIRLMEQAARLDLVSFEDPAFYDKLERARAQTSARLAALSSFARACQELISLVLLSASVFYYAPGWQLLLLVLVTPSFFSETRFALLRYDLHRRWTAGRRLLDYFRFLGASHQSAKEMKLFGLEDHLIGEYRSLARRLYAEIEWLSLTRSGVSAFTTMVGTAGYYAAYAAVVLQTAAGRLTIGDLTFLSGAFLRSRSTLQSLLSNVVSMADQATYLTDLFEFFALQPTLPVAAHPIPPPRPIRDGFEFRRVSFNYFGHDRLILRNLSFRLSAGEHVALIGENGAGKTTIVKLMARLYDPTDGVILLDGVDLREYGVADLRKQIGVVLQDYFRYDMRARDNIGFGAIDGLHDLARIERAAAAARATGVIDGLPDRFEQLLGKRFDGGVDLSGGEWQKIALARACMRDPQVLIMDEPTAAMDARAEYEIFRTCEALLKDRSALLISHRFSTVRMADQIAVLHNGQVEELGSHEELMAKDGRYAHLFHLQARGYRD